MGAFGVGNGAVFQLVGLRYRERIGMLTGLVGAAGGLGGFFLPTILGGARDAFGSYGPGIGAIAAAAAIALSGRWSSAAAPGPPRPGRSTGMRTLDRRRRHRRPGRARGVRERDRAGRAHARLRRAAPPLRPRRALDAAGLAAPTPTRSPCARRAGTRTSASPSSSAPASRRSTPTARDARQRRDCTSTAPCSAPARDALVPPIPGADRPHVHVFRGPEDCAAITGRRARPSAPS